MCVTVAISACMGEKPGVAWGYLKEDNTLWVPCLLSPPPETLRCLTEGISLNVTAQKTHVPARLVVHVWASSEVTSPRELSGCWLWDIGAPWLEKEGPSELQGVTVLARTASSLTFQSGGWAVR